MTLTFTIPDDVVADLAKSLPRYDRENPRDTDAERVTKRIQAWLRQIYDASVRTGVEAKVDAALANAKARRDQIVVS